VIGILSNMLAYIPVFFLVELFKRTSSRKSKSEILQNIINKNMSTSENIKMEEIKIENGSSKNKNNKCFPFPWWFKLILYCISFACMTLSICSIIFIGIHLKLFGVSRTHLVLLFHTHTHTHTHTDRQLSFSKRASVPPLFWIFDF
jgi:hypothetical protein